MTYAVCEEYPNTSKYICLSTCLSHSLFISYLPDNYSHRIVTFIISMGVMHSQIS